ncbi:MAG: Serine acetyltransferase [Firmicutes bacterium ADurb.Bin193]|nr:MAG: Serine acetyltransferase [Firmicutes bacterium ADurb.Bin193]
MLFKRIREDIKVIMERDPAARSFLEVYFLYPGLRAVISHRRAHWLYKRGFFFLARWISQRCRKKTGIEIHPAAQIGKGLFIDHGMGVVIGETTVIGDNCTLYQGVTLGGTGKDKGKRHPTIGNNVTIGSGAKVLGPFTVGDNSKIAAGAVVLSEVPPNSTCVGVPARVVKINDVRVASAIADLDQIHIPDPVSTELCRLSLRLERLEKASSMGQSDDLALKPFCTAEDKSEKKGEATDETL